MVRVEQSSEMCDLIDVSRQFGGMCYLHLQVTHTTLRHFPEDTKLHTPRKSSSVFEILFLNETKHRAMVNVQNPITYTVAHVYVSNSIIKSSTLDSAVDIATGYMLDDRGVGVPVPVE
jgi:hypothetical protein